MRMLKLEKKHIPYALLAVACVTVAILCIVKAFDSVKYNEFLSDSKILDPHAVTLVADGGNGTDIPKNTKYAVDDLRQKGFTNMKIDARLTADKKWVALADENISSITKGHGKVSTYSYYELLNYNLKAYPGDKTAVIELVEDTFAYANSSELICTVYIHNFDKPAIKDLLDSLVNTTTRVFYIASSDLRILEYAKSVIPSLNVIYYVDEITEENIGVCKNNMEYTLCFNADNRKNTKQMLELAAEYDVRTICYGAEKLKDIEKFYKMGIRFFVNDTVQIGDIQ